MLFIKKSFERFKNFLSFYGNLVSGKDEPWFPPFPEIFLLAYYFPYPRDGQQGVEIGCDSLGLSPHDNESRFFNGRLKRGIMVKHSFPYWWLSKHDRI